MSPLGRSGAFGRVTQKMMAQANLVVARIASAVDVKPAPDEVPTESTDVCPLIN